MLEVQEFVLELADFSGPATLEVSYSSTWDTLKFAFNAPNFWLDGDGQQWIQDRLGLDDDQFHSALQASLKRILEEA